MNNLMIFENKPVEVFELNGQVLFNPYHVGECLELKESAVRMAISKMNERQVIKLTNLDVKEIDIRKLNNAGENFLTESGVYKLIFKSKKKEAEKFQDWVTDEVLPQIRKTGSYKPKTLTAKEELRLHYKALEEQEERIEKVEKEFEEFKADMPLFNVECDELQGYVRKKGIQVLGGYRSNAYNDKSLRAKVYSDIQQQIRREFGVRSYKAIKRKQFDIAKEIINNYKPPIILEDEILNANILTSIERIC